MNNIIAVHRLPFFHKILKYFCSLAACLAHSKGNPLPPPGSKLRMFTTMLSFVSLLSSYLVLIPLYKCRGHQASDNHPQWGEWCLCREHRSRLPRGDQRCRRHHRLLGSDDKRWSGLLHALCRSYFLHDCGHCFRV